MKMRFLKLCYAFIAAVVSFIITACGGGETGPDYTSIDKDPLLSPAVDSNYHNIPSVKLGLTFNTDSSITFTAWDPYGAPKLNLYSGQSDDKPAASHEMIASTDANEGGIYRYSISATDASATPYYTFTSKKGRVYLDPYAPSMAKWTRSGVAKGAFVDISKITPDAGNWTTHLAGTSGVYFDGSKMQNTSGSVTSYSYSSNRDAIIYEAGIRDFTVDSANFPDSPNGVKGTSLDLGNTPFGTYKAFAKMLPHIRNLGVTHVQILSPLQNYNYNDNNVGSREQSFAQTTNANYNWGYDPQSYFTFAGMYSADPSTPSSRVNEMMSLVDAIHQNGMGCIIDVVYNHTQSQSILPDSDYYYRESSKSGCGNDTRSEAKMMRKLIVDSIVHMVTYYKVDGFRFDLMGIIDTGTIQAAYNAAKAINPNIIFVGEGWNLYSGTTSDYLGNAITGAEQQHADAFSGYQVSMFSDSYRNIFKNGFPYDGSAAFLHGTAQSLAKLFMNIIGAPTNEKPAFNAPSTDNVLSYMTAHDNLTLYDTLAMGTDSGKTADADAAILKRAKVGYTALMTSQGSTFIHGGDEMFRSKEATSSSNETFTNGKTSRIFCHNSYDASDAINKISWSNVYLSDPVTGGFTNYNTAANGYQLYQYVRGLISLRKSSTAFRLADSDIAANAVSLSGTVGTSTSIAYKLTDGTSTYYVFLNAGSVAATFTAPGVDFTAGTVIVDQTSAGTTAIASPVGVTAANGSVTLSALTSAVIKK